MTIPANSDECCDNYDRAPALIADLERQHNMTLPAAWHPAIATLLLRGLSMPSLHLIFETIQQADAERSPPQF